MLPRRGALLLLVALMLSGSGFAQEPTSSAPQSSPSNDQKLEEESADQSAQKLASETKVTPQQAEQLFRDVDTILDYASKDTSLPIKHGVKRRLTSREEVVSYLKKSMAEDKD